MCPVATVNSQTESSASVRRDASQISRWLAGYAAIGGVVHIAAWPTSPVGALTVGTLVAAGLAAGVVYFAAFFATLAWRAIQRRLFPDRGISFRGIRGWQLVVMLAIALCVVATAWGLYRTLDYGSDVVFARPWADPALVRAETMVVWTAAILGGTTLILGVFAIRALITNPLGFRKVTLVFIPFLVLSFLPDVLLDQLFVRYSGGERWIPEAYERMAAAIYFGILGAVYLLKRAPKSQERHH